MWLEFCWVAFILSAAVGIGLASFGLWRKDQGLLSNGLIVLGGLVAIIGIAGSLVNINDPAPVERLVVMIALFAVGLSCIGIGVVGLVKKDLFWRPKSQTPSPAQEKF